MWGLGPTGATGEGWPSVTTSGSLDGVAEYTKFDKIGIPMNLYMRTRKRFGRLIHQTNMIHIFYTTLSYKYITGEEAGDSMESIIV